MAAGPSNESQLCSGCTAGLTLGPVHMRDEPGVEYKPSRNPQEMRGPSPGRIYSRDAMTLAALKLPSAHTSEEPSGAEGLLPHFVYLRNCLLFVSFSFFAPTASCSKHLKNNPTLSCLRLPSVCPRPLQRVLQKDLRVGSRPRSPGFEFPF